MTTSGRLRIVVIGWLVATVALLVVGITLTALAGHSLFNSLANTAMLPFVVVGTLITIRRPKNAIGWLCLTIGAAFAVEGALWGAALYGLANPGTIPQPEFLAILGDAFVMPTIFLGLVMLPLLFPDGRLPSPGWRWLAWTAGGLIGLLFLIGPFLPATSGWGRPRLDNPHAIDGMAELDILALLLFPCVAAAMVALVLRFRASSGVQRLQMRWLVSAGVAAVALWVIAVFVGDDILDAEEASIAISIAGLVLIPSAIGVAVLRYRLLEIDRVISRTVTYVIVAGLVATVYALGVFGVQAVLPASGDLAVGGSTLVVAALFHPVRTRVHQVVDRRFNRSRYRAEAVLDEFSARVRDAVGVEAVVRDVLDIVSTTLEPRSVSLWTPPRDG